MAIPTKYDGIEYRSRLEARWAAFMMNIGWDIVYEPFDGDGYIPDFLVQGNRPMLIEVKPAVTQAEYKAPIAKLEQGLTAHWQHDILIFGASPFPDIANAFGHPAGWMGESLSAPDGEPSSWWWDGGEWLRCGKCGRIGVHHSYGWYGGRPCGHSEGDHFMGTPPLEVMRSMWADACNDVKWRGKAA